MILIRAFVIVVLLTGAYRVAVISAITVLRAGIGSFGMPAGILCATKNNVSRTSWKL